MKWCDMHLQNPLNNHPGLKDNLTRQRANLGKQMELVNNQITMYRVRREGWEGGGRGGEEGRVGGGGRGGEEGRVGGGREGRGGGKVGGGRGSEGGSEGVRQRVL